MGLMSDPLFVLLVSGDPQGHDDGFARCVWLRVAELVGRFSSDAKKATAVTKASIMVWFVHSTTTRRRWESTSTTSPRTTVSSAIRSAKRVQTHWMTPCSGFLRSRAVGVSRLRGGPAVRGG